MQRVIIALVLTSIVLAQSSAAESRSTPVVTLRGSPYERGRMHGEALRVSIAELSVKWKADVAATAGVDADKFIAAFLRDTDFATAIRKWTPELLDEVRGIADGARMPYQTVLAMQLLDELWTYASEYRESNHCSTIGVASVAGVPSLVAQNMDLEKFRDGHQVVLKIVTDDTTPAQLVFTCAGLIALNGVNETGIGVVVNTLAQLKSSPTGLPVAFVIRGLLAKKTERDAIQFLTSVPHASGQNYIVGGPTSVFDYEASAGKVVRYTPPGTEGLVYHTNHPLANDEFSKSYLQTLKKQQSADVRPIGNSAMRLASLDQRLRLRTDRPSLDVVINTLRSRDSEHAVCRRSDDAGAIFTFGSVVFTLSDQPTLRVSAGPPDRHHYATLGFEKDK